MVRNKVSRFFSETLYMCNFRRCNRRTLSYIFQSTNSTNYPAYYDKVP